MSAAPLRSRCPATAAFAALCIGVASSAVLAGPQLSVEAQVAWQVRNDVQSPNDASATRFALDGITGDGPAVTPRIALLWPIGETRHEVLGLVQPLRIDETGSSSAPIRFEGATFAAGTLRARYQFDSWRIGWRYRWIDRPDLIVRFGATAKIRDASIELTQGATRVSKDNTGFVPLLHASVERPVATGWSWALDVDALAGGPGYAIDAGAVLRYAVSEDWIVQGGVRFLDGGADNDEVYAFARFTGLTLGVVRRF
jgi:hypothetical protein